MLGLQLNKSRTFALAFGLATVACLSSGSTRADEGGVSMWLPGIYASLAATPLVPGWVVSSTFYHTSVSAGGDVGFAREVTTGRIPINLAARANLNLNADVNLGLVSTSYVFATPFLGAQATVGLMAVVGRNETSLAGTVAGVLSTPLGPVPFSRTDNIFDSVTGFGDLFPQVTLRWNAGVHNWMVYATGDIPVGDYDSTRLANLGIGHGAIDGGFGYTYFNPQTGHEFSGVLGLTYNFLNPSTQYQNGVDLHFDWGASQFLSKTVQAGLVGYIYKQISCDSGAGDRVGCFQSQVAAIGPQLGFIFPVGGMQGYLNFRAYKEFGAENRPEGWNAWVQFVISQAPPAPTAPPTRMVTK